MLSGHLVLLSLFTVVILGPHLPRTPCSISMWIFELNSVCGSGFCVFHASNGFCWKCHLFMMAPTDSFPVRNMPEWLRVHIALYNICDTVDTSQRNPSGVHWNARRNSHSNWKLFVLIMRCPKQPFNDIILHWSLTQTFFFPFCF